MARGQLERSRCSQKTDVRGARTEALGSRASFLGMSIYVLRPLSSTPGSWDFPGTDVTILWGPSRSPLLKSFPHSSQPSPGRISHCPPVPIHPFPKEPCEHLQGGHTITTPKNHESRGLKSCSGRQTQVGQCHGKAVPLTLHSAGFRLKPGWHLCRGRCPGLPGKLTPQGLQELLLPPWFAALSTPLSTTGVTFL